MTESAKPRISWLYFFKPNIIHLIFIFAFLSATWVGNYINQFDDPSGANGYFYLKQTESLATGHGFYFKDRSLSFLLPVIFYKLTYHTLTAYQLSIIVTWFVLIMSFGFLCMNLSRNLKPWQRFVGVTLLLGSVVSCTAIYEFGLTFYKNLFAVTLVVSSLAFFTSEFSAKFIRRLLSCVLVILALLSHKSAVFIVGCFLLWWLIKKSNLRQKIAIAVTASFLIVLLSIFFENGRQYFFALLSSFQFSYDWFTWVSGLLNGNQELALTMAGVSFLVHALLLYRNKFSELETVLVGGLSLFWVLCFHPFQAVGPESAAYRMILLSPVIILPFTMLILNLPGFRRLLFVLVVSPFLIQPFLKTAPLDNAFTPFSFLENDVRKIKDFVTERDHLTSHHGLEFYIDYITGIRSRSFLSNHPEKNDFRVAFVAERWLRSKKIQMELRGQAILEIGSEYILIEETKWQVLAKKFQIPFHWKNPNTQRPAHIYE